MQTYVKSIIPALLTCILLFTGCNSTKLTTNQKEGDLPTFDKAFIIINNYNETRFYRNLVTELRRELLSNTIRSEILTIDELSLKTEEDITRMIAEFNPQVVMEFKELRKTTTPLVIPDMYTPLMVNDGRVCLIEIKNYQTNEIIWKGKLVTDELWKSKQDARKSIHKLFEAFTNSNLISLR